MKNGTKSLKWDFTGIVIGHPILTEVGRVNEKKPVSRLWYFIHRRVVVQVTDILNS